MLRSKALEENLARYHVDVTPDPKYGVFQEIVSDYFGLQEGLNSFLKELSHPYRNWQDIIKEARGYALNYFHLIKNHPKGPEAASRFIDIFTDALQSAPDKNVRADAVDNLLLFLQKLVHREGS